VLFESFESLNFNNNSNSTAKAAATTITSSTTTTESEIFPDHFTQSCRLVHTNSCKAIYGKNSQRKDKESSIKFRLSEIKKQKIYDVLLILNIVWNMDVMLE
jgi:hypothetical protein